MSNQSPSYPWAQLEDEKLLKVRLCDLKLSLEGSGLEDRVTQLYAELEAKGLKFRPKIYLGDEWFSPEGMLAIAVPFYLAHPRLVALERRMMLSVEGEDPAYFQKLLRHEAGHTFDHAYRFSRRQKWRDIFGPPETEYAPETYRPKPYSRGFVRHLQNWYAQAHPDEDFAETFAVWLAPEIDWRKEYGRWPQAISKLQYMEELARSVAKKAPGGVGGYRPCDIANMRTTLGKYYARRRRENAQDYPDFYDHDLAAIFNGEKSLSKRDHGAGQYLRRNRKQILSSVSFWTGEHKYTIDGLLTKFARRCEELDLKLGRSEGETNLELSAYLATLVTHYLFTGKFKRKV